MNDKLQEYVDVITSEKSGEGVRDAIRHAIIVVDAENAKLDRDPLFASFKSETNTILNDLWEDVTHFFPNAIRPTYSDTDDVTPALPMSDDLKDALVSFKSSVNGADIRSSLCIALKSINENMNAHNIVTLYESRRINDLFIAFINASDDEEKKETAASKSSSWYPSGLNHEFEEISNHVTSNCFELNSVKSGREARPLIIDTLETLDSIMAFKRSHARMNYQYSRRSIAADLEQIATDLKPIMSFGRYNIAVTGSPYSNQADAEAAIAQARLMAPELGFSLGNIGGEDWIFVDVFDEDHVDEYGPWIRTHFYADCVCNDINAGHERDNFSCFIKDRNSY